MADIVIVLGDDTEGKTGGERKSFAVATTAVCGGGGVFELNWRGVKGLADDIRAIIGEPQNSIVLDSCILLQSQVGGYIESRIEQLGVLRQRLGGQEN